MRVELHQVSKRYGSTRALDGVSLAFEPGGIVAVIGLNGAGKATLLRALTGVVAPDRWNIGFDGQTFARNCLDQRRRFWFLPDFPPLVSPLQAVLSHVQPAR